MKTNMKKILIIIILQFSITLMFAQNAKQYYSQACEAYKEAQFNKTITYLKKCKSIIGSTNPKIEGLLMQAYYNNNDIIKSKIAYDNLLILTPKIYQESELFKNYKMLGKQINSAYNLAEENFQKERIKKANIVISEINVKIESQRKQKQNNKKGEEYFYNKIKNSLDADLLAEYKSSFPDSKNIVNIEKSIKEIDYWKYAKSKNTKSSYENYIDKYPRGKFILELKPIMAKIDKNAYNKAINTYTQESLNHYLYSYKSKYYLGNYKSQVKQKLKERIEYDAYLKAKNSNDIYYYNEYIEEYPYGKYADEINNVIQISYRKYGHAAFAQLNWKKAVYNYDYYLKHYPRGKYATEITKSIQDTYENWGDEKYKNRNFRESKKIYAKSLSKYPNGIHAKKINRKYKASIKMLNMRSHTGVAFYVGMPKSSELNIITAEKFAIGAEVLKLSKFGLGYYFGYFNSSIYTFDKAYHSVYFPENETTFIEGDYEKVKYVLDASEFKNNDNYIELGLTRRFIYPIWIDAGVGYGFGTNTFLVSGYEEVYDYYDGYSWEYTGNYMTNDIKYSYFSFQVGAKIVISNIVIAYNFQKRNDFNFQNLGIGFAF